MKRFVCIGLAVSLLLSCSISIERPSDKNTNWLRSCEHDSDCEDTYCICGVCTLRCNTDVSCENTKSPTKCFGPTSDIFDALCKTCESERTEGLCLPECRADAACDKDLKCIGGACVPKELQSIDLTTDASQPIYTNEHDAIIGGDDNGGGTPPNGSVVGDALNTNSATGNSGVAQWAQTVTGENDSSEFKALAIASDGSVYTAGSIVGTGTHDFGNGVTASGTYSASNIILVKYNSSGIAQWAKTVTAGSNISYFNSVAVASDGSVYAAGTIWGTGTYNFGNGVTAAGTYVDDNFVLVKYNSSGTAQWARTVEVGTGSSHFKGVAVASDGSVYAAGSILEPGTYNFGNGVTAVVTAVGAATISGNIVLVKYNSSGVAQWAQTVTTGEPIPPVLGSELMSVSVASDGSVYVAGRVEGTCTYVFGNNVTVASNTDSTHVVLVKYNSAGVAQWAQTVKGGSDISFFIGVTVDSSYFNGVTVASDGSVYTAGSISGFGTYDFGNNVTVANNTNYNPGVLVKYNSSGMAQWAKTVESGSGSSIFNGVTVASDGSVYAAGYNIGTGTYNFGNGVTASVTYGIWSIILVKYNSSGIAQWAQTTTAGGTGSFFDSVAVASDGSVYAAGRINETGTYNFGNSITVLGPGSDIHKAAILIKYK